MNNKKVYQELASLVIARQNCIKSNNTEWFNRHSEKIEHIIKNYLPSGSGIDSGIKIDLEKSNDQKLVFYSSYHNMDENGFYDGWSDFKLIVIPSLCFGFNLKIVGNFGKYQDTKDYLCELFNIDLDQELKEEIN
jgi:hypothetical protein